jgi:hypothetical protein
MDGYYCTEHAVAWLITGVQRLENAAAMPAHPVGPHGPAPEPAPDPGGDVVA